MIVLRKDQQRRPIGGHHFHDLGIVHYADTFEALIDKVNSHRIVNGFPVGNAKKEILRYYAERFPFMVRNGEGEDDPEPSERFVRFRHWVQTVWRNPPKKLITPKEASFRWDICKGCPHNTKFDWGVTEECKAVEQRSFMLRAGQETPKHLGFCALHRADLRVLSFVETPAMFSAKEKSKADHQGCWVSSLAGR